MSSTPSSPSLSQAYLDEYIGDRLTNTAIAFIVLETIFVALRCWSRYLQKASIGWDDILIIPAYTFCLGVCVCGILAVKHGGAGHHIDAVLEFAPEKLMYWGRLCLIVIPILYSVATTLPKLVILSAYLRIFVLKWSRIACYIIGTTVVTSCTINVILCIWQCSPPDYVWNKTIVNGYCRNDFQAHIRWGQLPNVLTDVAMLVLPLPIIWGLQNSRRVKIGLTATFIVGSLGLVTATVRFAEYFGTDAFDDETWASVKLVIWCCVEPGVYIIAACLLACRPLLHQTLHAGPLSQLWSQISKTKRYSDSSRVAKSGTDIELQAAQKNTYKGFKSWDDDLEALNTGSRSDANYVQASGQREKGSLGISADTDRIHVKREVTLRSDERSAPV